MNTIIPTAKQGLTQAITLLNKQCFEYLGKHQSNLKTLILLLSITVSFNLSSQISMVRLQASGPNNSLDETILYYQLGSSLGFDNDYDSYKLSGPNPALSIAQVYENTKFQINGIEPISSFLSMPIQVKTPLTGVYTIFATDFGNFPYGTSLILVDKYTGTKTNLKTSNYTFTLSDTTISPRFDLDISYMNMPIVEQSIPANCLHQTDNYIVKGSGTGPWNYFWKDTNENVVKVKLLSYEEDTFNLNLTGTYKVYIESSDGFGFNSSTFTIQSIDLPIASFSSLDTSFIDSISSFIPINNSVNATYYQWSFGEGNQSFFDTSSSHIYTIPGEYEVNLIAFNSFGCSDTATHVINIIDTTNSGNNVGIHSLLADAKIKLIRLNQHAFLLSILDSSESLVTIYDLGGRTIFSEKNHQELINLNLNHLVSGNYLIKVETNKNTKTFNINLF